MVCNRDAYERGFDEIVSLPSQCGHKVTDVQGGPLTGTL